MKSHLEYMTEISRFILRDFRITFMISRGPTTFEDENRTHATHDAQTHLTYKAACRILLPHGTLATG